MSEYYLDHMKLMHMRLILDVNLNFILMYLIIAFSLVLSDGESQCCTVALV